MTVIPDTPFDEDGWSQALQEMISLRKMVRSLQLQLVGEANDLNADADAVDQDTKNESGLSQEEVQALIDGSALPVMMAHNASGQTLTGGGGETLTCPTVVYGAGWDGSNYTVPQTGFYTVTITVAFTVAGATSGYASFQVYKNGAYLAPRLTTNYVNSASVGQTTIAATFGVSVAARDTISLVYSGPASSAAGVFGHIVIRRVA